jgi:hypothetical protein
MNDDVRTIQSESARAIVPSAFPFIVSITSVGGYQALRYSVSSDVEHQRGVREADPTFERRLIVDQ